MILRASRHAEFQFTNLVGYLRRQQRKVDLEARARVDNVLTLVGVAIDHPNIGLCNDGKDVLFRLGIWRILEAKQGVAHTPDFFYLRVETVGRDVFTREAVFDIQHRIICGLGGEWREEQ